MDCTYDPAYQTEEVDMTACQLAASKGIPFEVHNDVITDDGYILTMHRLPHNDTKRRYPVLLMHGLLQSSDVWLLNERNVSLAWVLWDQVVLYSSVFPAGKILKLIYFANRATMSGWEISGVTSTLVITLSMQNESVKKK